MSERNLRDPIEFELVQGLSTKFTGESTAGKGLVSAVNVDPYEKSLALGQVPGSTVVSSGAGAAWESIHYFEGFDLLDNVLTRKLIGLAGDTLYNVDLSSGGLTTLSGITQSGTTTASGGYYAEPLKAATMLNRLHLASPNNSPFKVDMSNYATRWGLEAPGNSKIVLFALDATTGLTAGTGTSIEVSAHPVPDEPNSTGSIQINKTGTSSTEAIFSYSGTAVDFGLETFFVYVYIPPGMLNLLSNVHALKIVISNGTTTITKTSIYYFDKGELTEGWNLLEMATSSPDDTAGLSQADSTGVTRWSFSVFTDSASRKFGTGSSNDGILVDHMFRFEQGSPIPTTSGNTLLEGFETLTSFGSYTTTPLIDSLHTQGSYSFRINKTTSATKYLVTRTKSTLNMNDQDNCAWDLYMPGNYISKLQATSTTATGIQFRLGNSTITAYREWRIPVEEFTEGEWNTVVCDLTNPDTTIGSPPALGSTAGVQWEINFNTTATGAGYDQIRLDNFRMITTDGALDATYSYVVTYVSRYDGWAGGASALHESNAGFPSQSISPQGEYVVLSGIPISPDPQVIARKIYRDQDADAIYRLVTTINDNVTVSYHDNTPLESTSSQTPPLAGDSDNDNSPPPPFYDVAVWNNSVFGINANNRNRIEVSAANEPESFPIVFGIDTDEELTALIPYNRALLVFSSDKTFMIEGSAPGYYTLSQLNSSIGIEGRRAFTTTKGFGSGLNSTGPWFFFQPEDPWFFAPMVEDKWADIATVAIKNAYVIHDQMRARILFFVQSEENGPYDNIFVWSYGKRGTGFISGEGSGIDPLDVRVGGWFELELPSQINPQCAEIVELDSEEDPLVYIGGNDGFIYHLQNEDTSTWAIGRNSTEAIRSEIETTDVPLGARDGRGRPRYLGMNVDIPTTTATLECTIITRDDFNGNVTMSGSPFYVTFSGLHDSKRVPVPGYLHGHVARVKVVHSGSGDRPILKSLRLYSIPIKSFSGPN